MPRRTRSAVKQLASLLDRKRKNVASIGEVREAINVQLQIARPLMDEGDLVLVKELATHLTDRNERAMLEKLGYLNMSQEAVLIDSLRKDLDALRQNLGVLCALLDKQTTTSDSTRLLELFEEESKLMAQLWVEAEEEDALALKAAKHIEMASNLEHKDWFRALMKGTARLTCLARLNVTVFGMENIPSSGPVVICPRHLHQKYDTSMLTSILPRKLFWVGATDWMKEGMQTWVVNWFYKLSGVVGVNRPEADKLLSEAGMKTSQYGKAPQLTKTFREVTRLLLLGQAVVIFPEGWPTMGTRVTITPDASGALEVKKGVFHFVHYTQQKMGVQIPIVPIGVKLEGEGPIRLDVVVKVGAPLYVPLTSGRIGFDEDAKKLSARIASLSV